MSYFGILEHFYKKIAKVGFRAKKVKIILLTLFANPRLQNVKNLKEFFLKCIRGLRRPTLQFEKFEGQRKPVIPHFQTSIMKLLDF